MNENSPLARKVRELEAIQLKYKERLIKMEGIKGVEATRKYYEGIVFGLETAILAIKELMR